jgi:hypothetical protein
VKQIRSGRSPTATAAATRVFSRRRGLLLVATLSAGASIAPISTRATGPIVFGTYEKDDAGGSFACTAAGDGSYRVLFLYRGTQNGSVQLDGTEVIGSAAITHERPRILNNRYFRAGGRP